MKILFYFTNTFKFFKFYSILKKLKLTLYPLIKKITNGALNLVSKVAKKLVKINLYGN